MTYRRSNNEKIVIHVKAKAKAIPLIFPLFEKIFFFSLHSFISRFGPDLLGIFFLKEVLQHALITCSAAARAASPPFRLRGSLNTYTPASSPLRDKLNFSIYLRKSSASDPQGQVAELGASHFVLRSSLFAVLRLINFNRKVERGMIHQANDREFNSSVFVIAK